MARTTRRQTPKHVDLIEAILQERGWSVATVIDRTRLPGESCRRLSADTMYKVLRGHTPSWPVQARIAAALSTPTEAISATQLFGERLAPAWAAVLVPSLSTHLAVAA